MYELYLNQSQRRSTNIFGLLYGIIHIYMFHLCSGTKNFLLGPVYFFILFYLASPQDA